MKMPSQQDLFRGACLDFPGDLTSHRCLINHGLYWPKPPGEGGPDDLGMFFWEFLCMPRNSGSRYMMSDGYGGLHGGGLLGFFQSGFGTINYPAGNVYGSDGLSFNTAIQGVKPYEWCVVAYGLDPVAGYLYTFVNGMIVSRDVWTGTRFCGPTVNGGTRRLYIGGSDHSNYDGRLQAYRSMEGPNGFFPFQGEAGYPVGQIFSNQTFSADQQVIQPFNLLCDLTGCAGARIIPDLSGGVPQDVGYIGTVHSGALVGLDNPAAATRNDGIPYDGAAWTPPLPLWTLDPRSPWYSLTARPVADPLLYPPKTPPVGVRVYDSFGGAETSLLYQPVPTLGDTEAGTAGSLTWQTAALAPATDASFCRRANLARFLSAGLNGIAYVQHASLVADCDVRVSRAATTILTNGGNSSREAPGNKTGLVFRLSDAANYWVAWMNDGDNLVIFPVTDNAAGGYVLNLDLVRFGGGASVNWSTLRILCSGTTLTALCDDTHGGWVTLGSASDQTFNQTATGAGIVSWHDIFIGFGSTQMPVWADFTIM